MAGGGADLARPAAQGDRLGPRRADQPVWSIDLVEGAVPRPRMRDLLRRAADAHRQGFPRPAGDGPHPRALAQIGDVLGVVARIAERFLVGIHVHKQLLGNLRRKEPGYWKTDMMVWRFSSGGYSTSNFTGSAHTRDEEVVRGDRHALLLYLLSVPLLISVASHNLLLLQSLPTNIRH
jgi:hypothetical protein